MLRDVRRIETIVARNSRGFGGKARNLAVLARAGFPVPAAYAIGAAVSDAFLASALDSTDLPHALLQLDSIPNAERLQAIFERVRRAEIPPSIARKLSDVWLSLRAEGVRAVAVRSSSLHEDQLAASAAGIHSTVLNVRAEADLLDAVRECWAGVYTPHAMAYLRGLGEASTTGMGLVVQALVPSDVSGVLFTVNPLTGDDGEMVINAAYGLGSAIVDGRVSPDTVRIDKATQSPRDRIMGDKTIRVVLNAVRGTRSVPVEDAMRAQLCLDDATVAELVRMGLRIEDHFGNARDVEWAVAEGVLYVLQARPITTLRGSKHRNSKRRVSTVDRTRIVWSNVNVGEALPGAATPLTWSVASSFSELGFRRAFGALGCSVPKHAELIGNFRGRIYLNLSEFMAIASQVPGLSPKVLLELGGGGGLEDLEANIDKRSRLLAFGFVARLPKTVIRFAAENFRLRDRVDAFETAFDEERRRIGSLDMRLLSPLGLDRTLRDVERLLDESGAIMLTCYGNLLSSVVLLSGVLRSVSGPEADGLQRDLLTGLADVESAAPGMSLWHIAEVARAEDGMSETLLAADATSLSVADLPLGPTRRAIENFLQAYGHRGIGEAELAEPRWREAPALLFTALQIHLRRPAGGERPIDVERRLRRVREEAQARLARQLPPIGKSATRHLLALVQRFMRLRERLRGYVVEVLGMYRRVALDVSRRIEQLEPGSGPDAAFFLHLDEIHAVLRRELLKTATLIGPRRLQYRRDAALPSPPDTFLGFPPPMPAEPPSGDEFRGLAASGGVVEGRARVLHSPADAGAFCAGEILVVACADVGWSPLFLLAGAVVTDLGGQLSHASVVLREYGVPAVVNVKVGTQVVETGDRLRVDGDIGTISILERAGK